MTKFILIVAVFLGSIFLYVDSTNVTISWTDSLSLLNGSNGNVTFKSTSALSCPVLISLNLTYNHSNSNLSPISYPNNFTFLANTNEANATIAGVKVGQASLGVTVANDTSCKINYNEKTKIHVFVKKSEAIDILSQIIGWIYFAAWTVSFYPQVYLNFKRKSVIGLNFDYLSYNITGFICYGLYNIGLFWIPVVQQEFIEEYPDGVNPVQVNDVVFVIHAVFVTAFTIFQCFIYDRGNQKVSLLARLLVGAIWVSMFALLFVAVFHKISWLTYLMVFSYVKLGITLIKYVPQAYMNYRRKSTEGWSIGNVLLDCVGGSFSILQMILMSYNNDQWDLIFGDPTKFGLGAFSVLFDILFMVQHYILYRPRKNNTDLGVLIEEDEDVFED